MVNVLYGVYNRDPKKHYLLEFIGEMYVHTNGVSETGLQFNMVSKYRQMSEDKMTEWLNRATNSIPDIFTYEEQEEIFLYQESLILQAKECRFELRKKREALEREQRLVRESNERNAREAHQREQIKNEKRKFEEYLKQTQELRHVVIKSEYEPELKGFMEHALSISKEDESQIMLPILHLLSKV
jgi:hypothetical protein